MATTSRAIFSRYWNDWDNMMEEISCPNGPTTCGVDEYGSDIFCGTTNACNPDGDYGPECENVSRYMCSKTCPEGEVLSPLRYCTCISEEVRDAMFCADDEDQDGGDIGS